MAKVVDKSKLSEKVSPPNKPWRTVRVFVSSTFRDMQAERDYLAKVVFPELRDRMAERHLHLVDLDLRWGVTEQEAEQGKVLDVILGEIDRSRPFFLGLLGERYGALPDKIPEDTKRVYAWLRDYEGYSYTSLEIVHGVLRNPEATKQAFFYFRHPQLTQQIPENRRIDYVAENTQSVSQLVYLKNKIRSTCNHVMENYPCYWDEKSGHVSGLETLGQRVLEDLWTAICEEYPSDAPEVDPVMVERQMHEAFVEERSYLHVGRVEQAAQLTRFVLGDSPIPVVIAGESGCGKSAFLANWYKKYAGEHPDDFVLAYFVGASPDSTSHYRLLRNMCKELKRQFTLEIEVPAEDKKLSEVFAQMLTSITTTGASSVWQRLSGKSSTQAHVRRVIVLLDALDQLLPLEAAHGLGWLLDYIPLNVRLVMSSLEGDCLDVLRRRGAEEIVLPPLSLGEQQQIIHALLETWGRKLDNKQTAALLAHTEARNPLYLRVALEELRLFGNFEQLTQRIESLAETIRGMFEHVLSRLEEDHGQELVTEAFALLGCSRYGLSETELLDVLRRKGEGQFSVSQWVRLSRSAKAYFVQRGELLDFFHDTLRGAVQDRYLNNEQKQQVTHLRLADYFEVHKNVSRKLVEHPWQLAQARSWQRLFVLLAHLPFLVKAWEVNESEVKMYWAQIEDNSPIKMVDAYRSLIDSPSQYSDSYLWIVSILLDDAGHIEESLMLREYLVEFYKGIGNHKNLSGALHNLASSYAERGKLNEAISFVQKAEEICRQQQDLEGLSACLSTQARILNARGEPDKALALHKEDERISRKLGNRTGIMRALGNQAVILMSLERPDLNRIIDLLRQQERICRELGNKRALAQCLGNQAKIFVDGVDLNGALALHKEEENIFRELGDPRGLVISLINQASLLRDYLGHNDEALAKAQEAFKIASTHNLDELLKKIKGFESKSAPPISISQKNWLKLEEHGPHAIRIDSTDYEGILQQLQKDAKLCKIVVGVSNGTRAISKAGKLSQEQLSVACAISLLALAPEILSKTNTPPHISDEFLGVMGIKWDSGVESKVFRQAFRIAKQCSEKVSKGLCWVRAPPDFPLIASVYDKQDKRYIILHSLAKQTDVHRVTLAALYGLNYDQIAYMVKGQKNVYDLEVPTKRRDIWEQIIKAWILHAIGKLPETNAWGWDKE